MMAVWRLLDRRDLKSLNAARTLLVSTANVAAVVIFIVAGAVRWRGTLVLTGGITVAFFVRALISRHS